MNANQPVFKQARFSMVVSLISNLCLAIIKWITGIFGNSYALIADAIESTADVLSSLLLMAGIRLAQKPADENHPYGHGKLESLITFAVAGVLLISGGIIAWQSIRNIYTPHLAPKPYTLIVLAVIIIWKEFSYRWLFKQAGEVDSSLLKAEAWHHRADAISSFAAFIGILIAVILGDEYAAADDWAALIAVGVIYYNAYRIFRPALGEIMDENLYDELIKKIREYSLQTSGVLDTEKCYVRKSGMHYYVDLHIEVNPQITVKEGHDIAHALQKSIQSRMPSVAGLLIHVEPAE